MIEVIVNLARVSRALRLHEAQERFDTLAPGDGFRGRTSARVHQLVDGARDEAVIDEEILFDAERFVAPLQIARSISLDAMTQREVLCPCRRPDRVRLHEPERIQRAFESRRLEQAARDGEPPQIVEGE